MMSARSEGVGDSSTPSVDVPDVTAIEFADGLAEKLEGMWGKGATLPSFYSEDVCFEDPLVSAKGIGTLKKLHGLLNDSPILTDTRMKVWRPTILPAPHSLHVS